MLRSPITIRPPTIWEHIFIIIGLLILQDAFRLVVPAWQMWRALWFLAIIGLTVLNFKAILAVGFRSIFITVLTSIAIVSVIWSEAPAETISRSIALVMTTFFAIYFATKYTIPQQIRMLTLMSVIIIVASLIFIFVLPQYGLQGHLWRGIFAQKNMFGRAIALGALLLLVYPSHTWTARFWRVVGYLVCVWMIFQSDSMTSLLTVFIITGLFFAYRALRLSMLPGLALFIASVVPLLIIATVVLTVPTDEILIALGRNPTLTGRTNVWDNLNIAINQSPWLGYGYGGFWNHFGGTYGSFWSEHSHFKPGSAHNSYLDLWVQLGIFALTVFVIGSISLFVRAMFHVRSVRTIDGLWPILFLSFALTMSFSEDFILFNHLQWMLYIAVAFSFEANKVRNRNAQPVYRSNVDLYTGTLAGRRALTEPSTGLD